MKLENLISMREYVLECYEEIQNSCVFENNCFNYANFLSQKLEIWQFIPCKLVDGVWVVLEEPNRNDQDTWLWMEYQQAKERCLFEGFEMGIYPLERFVLHKEGFGIVIDDFKRQTIEDLVEYNLKLTATA